MVAQEVLQARGLVALAFYSRAVPTLVGAFSSLAKSITLKLPHRTRDSAHFILSSLRNVYFQVSMLVSFRMYDIGRNRNYIALQRETGGDGCSIVGYCCKQLCKGT